MRERDQLGGALRGLDPGEPRGAEHVALRRVAGGDAPRPSPATCAPPRGHGRAARSPASRRRRPSVRGRRRRGGSAESPPTCARPTFVRRGPNGPSPAAAGSRPRAALRRAGRCARRAGASTPGSPFRAPRRRAATRRRAVRDGSQDTSLDVHALVEAELRVRAPEAGVLDAAPGALAGAVRVRVVVDPDHARLDPVARSARPWRGRASRPTRRGRTRESFASAIASSSLSTRHDRQDRAEDLLAHDPHVVGDAGEHGRRDEVAAEARGPRPGRRRAAWRPTRSRRRPARGRGRTARARPSARSRCSSRAGRRP